MRLTQDLNVEAVGEAPRSLAGEDPRVSGLGVVDGEAVLPLSLLRGYRPAYENNTQTLVTVTMVQTVFGCSPTDLFMYLFL